MFPDGSVRFILQPQSSPTLEGSCHWSGWPLFTASLSAFDWSPVSGQPCQAVQTALLSLSISTIRLSAAALSLFLCGSSRGSLPQPGSPLSIQRFFRSAASSSFCSSGFAARLFSSPILEASFVGFFFTETNRTSPVNLAPTNGLHAACWRSQIGTELLLKSPQCRITVCLFPPLGALVFAHALQTLTTPPNDPLLLHPAGPVRFDLFARR
jgi:hypothetical protein